MTTAPLAVKRAIAWVRATHRRLPSLVGGMWAISLEAPDGSMLGCVVVGRPGARKLQRGTYRLELTRCAVVEGVKGGCSKLYGAAARTARAQGAWDLFTYTHADEPGTSLIAAGWIREERDGEPIVFGGGGAVVQTLASACAARRGWAASPLVGSVVALPAGAAIVRAYCRACSLAFNVGIGSGLTTKSYRCSACSGELHVMPGPKWRFGGRITTPERVNADQARSRHLREAREARKP